MIRGIKIIKLTKLPIDLSKWVDWLNDKIVTKYSKQRLKKHTNQSQKKFLKKKLKSKRNLIFKIIFYLIFFTNTPDPIVFIILSPTLFNSSIIRPYG